MRRSMIITRREWANVLVYAGFLLLITTIPYLLAYTVQGSNWTFNGFIFGVEDGNAYLGKMRLGARGEWQFFLFFTPEEHDSAGLLYLPYIIPGQLIGLLVDDHNPMLFSALIIVFHALRIIFDLILILVLYRFIATFLLHPSTRFLTLILATLGGGLGWILIFFGAFPPEFFIPEGFSFLVLLGLPHIALARAALLGGFLLFFQTLSAQTHGWRWGLAAGSCWLIVGLSVSFYFLILYCLLAVWGLVIWIRQRTFPWSFAWHGGIAVTVTLPLFAYYLFTFTQNEAFAQWSSQNLLPSPPPLHYLLAYGVLAGLGWIGGRWAWRHTNDPRFDLLVGWVCIVPILVYLPINVQRRLAESVLIPLSILAVAGLRLLVPVLATRQKIPYHRAWQRIRQGSMILLTSSSALFLVISTIIVLNPSRPLFRPTPEITALDWLNNYAADNEIVLGAKETGNLIPARTNLRVFLGHGPETLSAENKEKQVAAFFGGELAVQQQIIQHYNIRYIFVGPLERDLADNQNIDENRFFTKVYDEGGYQIFEAVR